MHTVVHIRNLIPSIVLVSASPYEIAFYERPPLEHFRVFDRVVLQILTSQREPNLMLKHLNACSWDSMTTQRAAECGI